MGDHFHTLSLHLYEILDWIGASEEIRGKYRERSIIPSIVASMIASNYFADNQLIGHVFGSSCEGTTTFGMNSDVDWLGYSYTPVIERISDSPPCGVSYLMVADETTKSGYFKLQLVLDKNPIYYLDIKKHDLDQHGRVCVRHFHGIDNEHQETNGPAITFRGTGFRDHDIVIAYRCKHIPSFAISWVSRVTGSNRLNDTQIKYLKESACFFVGKNHPASQNPLIEWRLSFSLQERELMNSLNSTQHKCYILLKMIKKDIINKLVPESISSYHCKTCVLYAIEHTQCEYWTRRNLLECTFFCIKLLLHWVKEQYCPNYFNPDENMFDKLENRTLRRVQAVLEDMVEHWCRFIWSLTCDNIGSLMSNVLFGSGPSILIQNRMCVSKTAIVYYISINAELLKCLCSRLKLLKNIPATRSILELHSTEVHFLQTSCFRDHTEKETRQAIHYFIPHVRLQIAQGIASIMLTTIATNQLRMLFILFKYYIEESKNCNTIAALLILASYCLHIDRNDVCERILLQCETSLKAPVLSVCGCKTFQIHTHHTDAKKELERMLSSNDIPYTEFVRTYTAGCLTFLPSHSNIVPKALRYEMYRSVNTPPGSRNESSDFWFDWSVVDSKVYTYYLQYILYSKTNKLVLKQAAVDNLFHVIHTDQRLGHKETAYNLLGWMFSKEKKPQQAMECFKSSWRIRPIHNAAKWHVLEMLRSINRI